MSDEDKYFTLVFKGNIRKFKHNPLRTKTQFGVPVAAGVGDAFAKIDQLEEEIGRAADASI
jgi:hypothetical protein